VRIRNVSRERFQRIGHRMYIIYPPASPASFRRFAVQSFSSPTQQTEA